MKFRVKVTKTCVGYIEVDASSFDTAEIEAERQQGNATFQNVTYKVSDPVVMERYRIILISDGVESRVGLNLTDALAFAKNMIKDERVKAIKIEKDF